MNMTKERLQLLEMALKLPEKNARVFKLLYGHFSSSEKLSVEQKEALSIEDDVKHIPSKNIDWATTQIMNTFMKRLLEGVDLNDFT